MSEKSLTAIEAELYDRQIRLWGIESQEKLRAANILLIGVRALGSEIAKNILLSGINSLTILDDTIVTESTLQSNFFITKESIGKQLVDAVLTKITALNPLVSINVDAASVGSKHESFFDTFSIVIGTGLKTRDIIRLGQICRERNIKIICADVFGLFGFTMADFQEHQYFEEIPKMIPAKKRTHNDNNNLKYERVLTKIQDTLMYPDMGVILDTDTAHAQVTRARNPLYYLMLSLLRFRDEYDRDPLVGERGADVDRLRMIRAEFTGGTCAAPTEQCVFGVVAPVCSIVGGIVAQEVIKAVSGKEVPIRNVFLLDPITFNGKEEFIRA